MHGFPIHFNGGIRSVKKMASHSIEMDWEERGDGRISMYACVCNLGRERSFLCGVYKGVKMNQLVCRN